MALRSPPLLRRRPAGPASVRLPVPPRPLSRAAKTSSFPLLPALSAALVLLGGAQMGLWWWQSRLPGIGSDATATRSNPFMAIQRPAPQQATGNVREAQRLSALPLPQNLQFGDAMARVTVTIFTDPSCGACREKVRAWTAGLPVEGVRQVYKFWPQDPDRLTPGMLVELARRQGVTEPFWRSLQGAGTRDLDDPAMLDMLNRAGLPLTEVRTALVNEGVSLMTALEPDILTAKSGNLPRGPVLMVDDYVLDGGMLSPENLGLYVKKRLKGRQVLERD